MQAQIDERDRDLYQMLSALAEKREECPSYEEIGRMMGRSRNYVRDGIARLRRERAIDVRTITCNRRQIIIEATGKATASGATKVYSVDPYGYIVRTTAEDTTAIIEAQTVHRNPCVRCGVREDRHADLGCKRFVGSRLI